MFLSLLERFGNPHLNLPPVIHVAGTNGKGSIIAMLRSILEAAGYKVHAYTSPHLIHVNERIYLAGENISDEYIERLIDDALGYIDNAPLSFFEVITAIAFKAFSNAPADIVLLEVGMGGLLDCTNVIEAPLVSVINRISMDHTDFLGNTLKEIAAQKAGIMKKSVPCVIGGQGQNGLDALDVFREKAQTVETELFISGQDWTIESNQDNVIYTTEEQREFYTFPALVGTHQILNMGVVLTALERIKTSFPIRKEAIETGLSSVIWPGRLQRLDLNWPTDIGAHEIWVDSGHNDSAGIAIAEQIVQWLSLIHI